MAPSPFLLPCALTLLPTSHRDVTTPSPCWGPHFRTQERLMFSSLTSSEPRPSSAATMTCCRLSLYPCTAPLSCSLQQFLKLWLLSFEPSLLQFVSSVCHCDSVLSCCFTETRSLNLCVCLYLSLFCLCFSNGNRLQL